MRTFTISDFTTNDNNLNENIIINVLTQDFSEIPLDEFSDTWGGFSETSGFDMNLFDAFEYNDDKTFRGIIYGLIEVNGAMQTDTLNMIASFDFKIFEDNVEYLIPEWEYKQFTVRASWEMCGSYVISANSQEEAEEIVMSSDTGLPENASFIEGSFKIDGD